MMRGKLLELQQVACGYGRRPVLENVSFHLQAGELLCMLGPNGVGKTTLFKTVLGLLPCLGGEIRLQDTPTRHWPRRRFARWVGYVPQAHTPPFPFRVHEVVTMGRVAHLGPFASPRAEDRAAARRALEALEMGYLADSRYTEISGGERQLVLIARALAQDPRVLVMDEPTANLDYGNQLKVMAHVRRIAAEREMGIVLTTHHPNHALLYASRVLVLDRERRCHSGAPAQVITEHYLRQTYGVEAEIHAITHRDGQQTRLCVPAPIPKETSWT